MSILLLFIIYNSKNQICWQKAENSYNKLEIASIPVGIMVLVFYDIIYLPNRNSELFV